MMSSDDASAPGSASPSSCSSSSYNPPCLSRSSSSSTMTSVYQEQQERRTEARPAEDVPQSPGHPIKPPSLPSNIDHEDDTCTSTLESPPHLERRVHRMIPSPAPAAFHAPVLPGSRILRATPFQRLVHHRNLPKNGTIDPLKINEYLATAEAERAMVASVSVAAAASQRDNSTAAPPISEIEIKVYPKNDRQGGDFVELCSEDWKGLYMSSQRELYHSQRKLQHVVQENRFWKRQLIELQKRLYETRRNNHLTSYQNKRSATSCMCPSCVAHHAAVSSRHYAAPQPWTVPESSAPTVSSRPSKRLRVGFQVREVSQHVVAYSSSSHASKSEPNLRAVSHEEQQVGQQPLEPAPLSCATTTTTPQQEQSV